MISDLSIAKESTDLPRAPTYTPASSVHLSMRQVSVPLFASTRAALQSVMPYYELRSKLAKDGKTPEQIAEGVQAAYAKGELPKREGVSFAYMWSADHNLGPGIGHWHPHLMVFAPYYENSMLGGNEFGVRFHRYRMTQEHRSL